VRNSKILMIFLGWSFTLDMIRMVLDLGFWLDQVVVWTWLAIQLWR
jgi:hypothetical protein